MILKVMSKMKKKKNQNNIINLKRQQIKSYKNNKMKNNYTRAYVIMNTIQVIVIYLKIKKKKSINKTSRYLNLKKKKDYENKKLKNQLLIK